MEKEQAAETKRAKKAQISPKIEPKTDTSKIYELGYILLPTLDQDKVNAEVDTISKLFTKAGGEFISGEAPVLIDLAYQMVKVIHTHRQKCDEGYFGWMKFEIETEAIAEIKKALDLSETILRYLLVKTVRENTLLDGKMHLRVENTEDKTKKMPIDEGISTEGEIAPEVNQEQLDKSIDDLVIA